MSILLIPLTLLCAAVWVAVASPTLGRLLAVPAVGGALLLGGVGLLLVTPIFAVPLGIVVVVTLIVATVTGVALVLRRSGVGAKPSRRALALWAPATVGALAWLAVRAASLVVPGASKVSWAIEGDATNNLYFARRIVDDNGILLGPDQNPVPLAASLLAVPLSIDRLLPTGGALESDLWIFAAVWTVLLTVCCVAMGAVTASLVDPRRRGVVVVASAAGSLLPLTWFVAGLPIEYGYLNVHVALPLSLASWLAYLGSQRAPAIAVAALVCLSALLLTTWSPVVFLPVLLGVLVAVRNRRELSAARGSTWLAPALAVALFVLLAAGLTVPTFFAQTEALAAPGHGFPATWLLSSALAIAALSVAALLRSQLGGFVFVGAVAIVLASYAGLLSTFYVSRDLFDPWNGYYPVKLAWLIAALLLPVVASLLIAGAAAIERRGLRAAAVGLAALLVGALAVAPPVTTPVDYVARQPADRILGGHVWKSGDAAVDVILALAARDQVGILWQSVSPDEALINYWAIDAAGGELGGDPVLRGFAFKEYSSFRATGGHNAFAENAFCALLRDPGSAIVVYTDNPSLEGDLAGSCTGATADFVVGATPGVVY